jgi:leucine efflux protein
MFGITDMTTYVLGVIFIILLPGPNSLYVLSVASQRGVRAGYLGACGVFLGDTILMVLSAAGAASLLKTYPAAFIAVKYAGAAYLAWLGVQMLKGVWQGVAQRSPVRDLANEVRPAADDTHPFKKALLLSLLNPKAILFFISFFIQFVDPGYAYPALSFTILGVIVQFFSALYLSTLIFSGARLAAAFRRRRTLSTGLKGGVGLMFIGFSAKLATATIA